MNPDLLKLTDTAFPVSIIEHEKSEPGTIFPTHLHEKHLQLFYFTQGNARIYCNQTLYETAVSPVILINRNELHSGENVSDTLRFFVFRIDLELLLSCPVPAVTSGYIRPLYEGLILLQNEISGNSVTALLDLMIREYRLQEDGYELRLISAVYELLCILLRFHKRNLYRKETAEALMQKTRRLSAALDYMEQNYTQSVSLSDLAAAAHVSEEHFCRIFKKHLGRTPVDYLNRLRIEKAVILLNQGICNVTEAGMTVGFDDINYFSRVFKKYMLQSPEHYLKNDRKYFL